MGHKGHEVQENIDRLLEECMGQIREAATPRHVRLALPVSFRKEGVFLENAALLLPGKDIARLLDGCTQAVLMAATLGTAADSLILRSQSTDLTRSLVLDACATQLIEQYCDEIEQQICGEAQQSGLTATPRFSPGYGDLPLGLQPALLSILDAGRKIGLTCTESLIMLPRKSVTALIGLGPHLQKGPGGCTRCAQSDTCNFRKG